MTGTLYHSTKVPFISIIDTDDEVAESISEDDDDSDNDFLVRCHLPESRKLSRTVSLNSKRYHNMEEMLVDLKKTKSNGNGSGSPDKEVFNSRKVTFTLEQELDNIYSRICSPRWFQQKFTKMRAHLILLSNLLSDWLFLAMLGVNVACISIAVDLMVFCCQEIQRRTVLIYNLYGYDQSYLLWILGLLCWCGYTIGLITASACFVHFVSPQAIGSGIPEMKTIIRGVILVDYLTLKTLISKIVGIAMTLGSGVPIGKMGPFVHIASVVANQMCIVAAKFDSAYREESRRMECLAAACAVGVACTFSSPVGGVLFSIEVTTMYFSVRSYWRGFFAACCGATTIRLLRGYVVESEVTVNAFYQTSFRPDAFSVNEIPLFALLGLLCGILGAGYITIYRCLVLFLRNNKFAKLVFQRHWIVYPIVISIIFSMVSYPHGLGMFSTGRIKFGTNLRDFFANCSFLAETSNDLSCGAEIFSHWLNRGNILMLIFLFVIFHFVFSIISFTLPVPSGVFLPVFVLGAAIGRFYGEVLGIALKDTGVHIVPGIYAVVGAASFSASVTHTVSVSVMIFEITGQLHFILPVMISVMLANAVCAYLQPSFFDTIIKIKHLPFLPDIPPSNNLVHTTCAEHIMVSPVKFITKTTTYHELREMVATGLRLLPVVDSKHSQMLVGTVSRRYLTFLLNQKIGDNARKLEAEKKVRRAIETIDNHFKDTENEMKEDRRAHSETDFSKLRKTSEVNASNLFLNPDFVSKEEKINRFLVVPLPDVAEPKILFPPVHHQTLHADVMRRRNSGTRRNALFSLQEMNELSRERFDDIPTEHKTIHASTQEHHTILRNYMRQAKKYLNQIGSGKKGSQESFDLTPEERSYWEQEQLASEYELTESDIDPAPIQLVKHTSLYKIHSIFSMLQLSKAYVTDCGRLIGVVALSDLRKALEHTVEIVKESKKRTLPTHIPPTNRVIPQVSTNVIDILTPPLEVARGTTIEINLAVPEVVSEPKATFSPLTFQPRSSLRYQNPRNCISTSNGENRQRSHSVHEQDPKEFAEAVAYLRRKSHAIPNQWVNEGQDGLNEQHL